MNCIRSKHFYTLVIVLILSALIFVAQGSLSIYYIGLISLVGINAILVISLNITNGYTGMFSLALGGLMGIAAYISGLLTLSPEYKAINLPSLPTWLITSHWSLFPAALLGALVATLLGTVFTWPSLRLRGHYFALSSLAFAEIVRLLASNMQGITRGAKSLTSIASLTNLWWIYGWLVIEILIVRQLFRTRFGQAMIAIREDEGLAQISGVNLTTTKIHAFIISAFFAGIGGALWVHYTNIVSPGSFRLAVIFTLFIMFTVGGQGSITGAIIGATFITVLPQILRPLEEGGVIFGFKLPPLYGLTQIIMALFLVLILVKRPDGIMGRKEISFEWINIFWNRIRDKISNRSTI